MRLEVLAVRLAVERVEVVPAEDRVDAELLRLAPRAAHAVEVRVLRLDLDTDLDARQGLLLRRGTPFTVAAPRLDAVSPARRRRRLDPCRLRRRADRGLGRAATGARRDDDGRPHAPRPGAPARRGRAGAAVRGTPLPRGTVPVASVPIRSPRRGPRRPQHRCRTRGSRNHISRHGSRAADRHAAGRALNEDADAVRACRGPFSIGPGLHAGDQVVGRSDVYATTAELIDDQVLDGRPRGATGEQSPDGAPSPPQHPTARPGPCYPPRCRRSRPAC